MEGRSRSHMRSRWRQPPMVGPCTGQEAKDGMPGRRCLPAPCPPPQKPALCAVRTTDRADTQIVGIPVAPRPSWRSAAAHSRCPEECKVMHEAGDPLLGRKWTSDHATRSAPPNIRSLVLTFTLAGAPDRPPISHFTGSLVPLSEGGLTKGIPHNSAMKQQTACRFVYRPGVPRKPRTG